MDDLELVLFGSFLVILIQTFIELRPASAVEDLLLMEQSFGGLVEFDSHDVQFAMATAALYDYRLNCGLLCFEDDLWFWVKLCSTVWFGEFLMNVFDDGRWIQNFHMDKGTIAGICDRLRPHVRKQDTTYRKAVPVEVRICVCLYKLAHGANILTCSEHFAIGRSTVGMCIREFVAAINLVYRGMISWSRGIEIGKLSLILKVGVAYRLSRVPMTVCTSQFLNLQCTLKTIIT
jgi:hypothetical protein